MQGGSSARARSLQNFTLNKQQNESSRSDLKHFGRRAAFNHIGVAHMHIHLTDPQGCIQHVFSHMKKDIADNVKALVGADVGQ